MTSVFIKCITELKNCGIFHNWPKGQIVFGRYNLIYSWNGSGKTTLSRVMRSLEHGTIDPALPKGTPSPSFQFELTEKNLVNSTTLSGFQNNIRVFNCDFVRDNINSDDAEAEPVYHLGSDQGEALKKKIKAEKRIAHHTPKLDSAIASSDSIKKVMEEALTAQATLISNAVSDRTYNKSKLRRVLEKYDEEETEVESHILTDSALASNLATASGSNDKAPIDEISFSLTKPLDKIYQEAVAICNSSVTKAAIEELDTNDQLRSWVEQGTHLHKDKETCSYCDSKIPSERIELLNKYFNAAYEGLMDKIETTLKDTQSLATTITKLTTPDESRLHQVLRERYKIDVNALKNASNDFTKSLSAIDTELVNKKGYLTTPIQLDSYDNLEVSFSRLTEALATINKIIQEHNEIQTNFQNSVLSARKKVSEHYSASHYATYKESLNKLQKLADQSKPREKLITKLKDTKEKLDSQLREHEPAVERINDLLASFLGRNTIKLLTHDKGYYIEREGERARNLSEGERTAIAFTYFIAKLEEKEFELENSVIVVDDPISSLDTNSLYAAAAFIRCHLERASQVFIMTHNHQFFREIFGWIRALSEPDDGAKPYKSYTMLKCEVNSNGKRHAIPQKLDNTLKNYDSEYVFLVHQLLDASKNAQYSETATPDQISKLMQLPNIARRVLETFILFKFPAKANGSTINLYNAIKPLGVEVAHEKISMLDRLLNRVSHGGDDGMSALNVFNLSETPKIIQYVLEFIEEADEVHYAGLMQALGVQYTKKTDASNQSAA